MAVISDAHLSAHDVTRASDIQEFIVCVFVLLYYCMAIIVQIFIPARCSELRRPGEYTV